MKNKIEIAEKRFNEMENRKSEFMKPYRESGSERSLESASNEQENMDKLALAIMEAKKEEV